MNRRGFLGFFGAGAVAAPKLAAGIAEDVSSTNYMPAMSIHGCGSASEVGPDTGWKARRVKELRAVISGRDPDAARQDQMNRLYALEMVERLRLDGLRSVSPVNKQRILVAGASSRGRRIRQADAGWDLKRLLAGN